MVKLFTKVVVDNREEGKFRSRALNHLPNEHMEALWGYVRGDVVYICAFVKMEIDKSRTNSARVTPKEDDGVNCWELDHHEDDAAEAQIFDSKTGQRVKLEFLGTIHSHPDCDDAVPSEHDIRGLLNTQESVTGICAIEFKNKGKKNQRRITKIDYWPAVRPLPVERRKTYESSVAAAAGKRRAKRK